MCWAALLSLSVEYGNQLKCANSFSLSDLVSPVPMARRLGLRMSRVQAKLKFPNRWRGDFLDGGHALDSQCSHRRSHRKNKRQIQKRTFSLSQGGRGNHVKRIFWVTSRAYRYDGAESQSSFDLWDFYPSGCLPEQWKIIPLTLEIFSEKTYLQEAEHEESEGVEEIRRNARNSTLFLSTSICLDLTLNTSPSWINWHYDT